MRRRLIICFGLSLAWQVSTAAAHISAQVIGQRVEALPAIACHFESSVTPSSDAAQKQVREWYMWRQAAQVETRESGNETGEVWRLSRNGQISYQRVFHKEKRMIEYTPGDLRSLHRYPDWSRLAGVIDPAILNKELKVYGVAEILGRSARRYQGRLNGVEVEVWWLEREQVPALIRQVYTDREVTLRLNAIYPLSKSPWPHDQTAGYASIDYVDLGDKQIDPFVRRLPHSH